MAVRRKIVTLTGRNKSEGEKYTYRGWEINFAYGSYDPIEDSYPRFVKFVHPKSTPPAANRREALALERHYQEQYKNAGLAGNGIKANVTLRSYMEMRLDNMTNRQPRTIQGYRENMRVQVYPRIGHIEVRKMDARFMASFFSILNSNKGRQDGKGPLSGGYINAIRHQLNDMFEDAIEDNLILSNPLQTRIVRRTIPKVIVAKQPTPLSVEEIKSLVEESATTRYQPYIKLAVMTGFGPAELGGLLWEDIQLPEVGTGAVRVKRNLLELRTPCECPLARYRSDGCPHNGKSRSSYYLHYGPPKEDEYRDRQMALSPGMVEYFRAYREASLAIFPVLSDKTPVFHERDGSHWMPKTAARGVKRILKRIGRGDASLYTLRSTYSSHLQHLGTDFAPLRNLMGHSPGSHTLEEHYLRSLDGQEEAAILRLDAYIFG